MDKYKFGEFIYNRRTALNLTQEELGRKLGVTNKAVSKWEVGETLPDVQLIPDLAKTLNVSIDELYQMEVKEKEVEEKKVTPKWKIATFILTGILLIASCIIGVLNAYCRNINRQKQNTIEDITLDNYRLFLDITPCIKSVSEENEFSIYGRVDFTNELYYESEINLTLTYSMQYYYYSTSGEEALISYINKTVDVIIEGKEGKDFSIKFSPKNSISDYKSFKEMVLNYEVTNISGTVNNKEITFNE